MRWVQTITYRNIRKSKKPQWARERAHLNTILPEAVRPLEAMAANRKEGRATIKIAPLKTTKSPRIRSIQKLDKQTEATKDTRRLSVTTPCSSFNATNCRNLSQCHNQWWSISQSTQVSHVSSTSSRIASWTTTCATWLPTIPRSQCKWWLVSMSSILILTIWLPKCNRTLLIEYMTISSCIVWCNSLIIVRQFHCQHSQNHNNQHWTWWSPTLMRRSSKKFLILKKIGGKNGWENTRPSWTWTTFCR